jgi:curli biogenesis system outer membrane secretion channel CsgG
MKKLALVIAFVLLAAVSASAAEISQTAPATPAAASTPALEQLPGGTPPPLFMGPHQLTPRCYTLAYTSCPAAGATTACTDVCNNALSCTCYNTYAPPYYVIVTGHYWYCNEEC